MSVESSPREVTTSGRENLLLKAAAPLLNAVVQIRQAATHDDPAGLRQSLIDEIRLFEQRCKQAGLPFEMIIGARYCVCSALDEAAAQTPWGTRGVWSGNGMLVTFHNESWGGEKFFQLLSRISQSPQQHLWLLEIIHYCLLLGYEGRYRGSEKGRAQCDSLRARLKALIDETRAQQTTESTPLVQVHPLVNTLARPMVPLWACAMLVALIGCLIYSGLNWRLGNAAEPLLRSLYNMPLPQIMMNRRPSSPQALLDLRQRLNDVIAAGQLEVSDGAFGSKVIIPADKLFAEQGTVINPVGRALLARVSAAMKDVKGTILVSVFTDDQPVDGSRFASNYEFSFARARAISQLLQVQLADSHVLRSEGRGDSDPLLPNDSSENRTRNRRVEITLFAAPETLSTHQGTP
ncbi:type IVB secretion system protein IcmH/DotU [Pantoea sp. BS_4]|uniref:Membrane protein n=1 Tax=Pantoea stewartii TaxID=66269 RepID=A0AB34VG37_9GAMM|nr:MULTISPECIES: type IVB secretion system protein IcmH/DotU [Pantoea]KKW50675.1 membrane protein [Pantoea ananatis]KGD82451.1 membrane protein [Pantoea stewartii subsp. indologenes]KHE03378.1 membrane protein [Pantoea stewartii]KHN61923.1 membrane protein [Pantoea stewartii]KTS28299.1 membrane protein [Pantoea stewartii]